MERARRPRLVGLSALPDSVHLFRGHTVLATARDGVIDGRGSHGLFFNNTRILSRFTHTIDGERPRFVAASPVDACSMLAYYQAPHLLQQVPRLNAEEPGLVVRVTRTVGDGMHEDVDLENYTQQALEFTFSWSVSADFADIEETIARKRRQEAPVTPCWQERGDGRWELSLRYEHPQLSRGVVAVFDAVNPPPRFDDGTITYQVELKANERRHFCVRCDPVVDGERRISGAKCYAFHVDQRADGRGDDSTRMRASNPVVQAAWDHAAQDLKDMALGDGRGPEVLVPAAGIPKYQSLFGRDAITVGFQSAMVQPVLIEAALSATASRMGSKRDDLHDEEPGRIVQQVNLGPLATLGITPMVQYYGDYAAPPAFLIALGQHFAWTGDAEFVRRYYDHAMRVLEWIDGAADLDGDGFLEHETRSPMGNRNQGWKDSGMALVDEYGRGVDNPVAPCEVQGYVYAGKQQFGVALALAMHKLGEAKGLLSDAASLKRRFNDAFWMPEAGFIAYALDPQKRQVRSITSNPAHCLATGIVDGAHARAVAERMLEPDMFSGWGVRTLSSAHPSFNPFSYHLGTVWPVEAATAAFGMKRYGFHDEANRVAKGMFDVAALFPHHRLPEVIGGYQRDEEHPHPGMYPQAQSPQAWSASAVPLLIQSMLGLRPFAPARLLLIDPVLPEWLPDVVLRHLRVGRARVDLRFHRERDGTTGWKVLRKQGALIVVQQPPESSVTAGAGRRAAALVGSAVPWLH